MKKLFGAVLAAILGMFLMSCGGTDDDDPIETKPGLYKIEVTQSGDIDKFTMITGISGGDNTGKGVYDLVTNQYAGISFQLTQEEAARTYYGYATKSNGLTIGITVSYYIKDRDCPGTVKLNLTLTKDGQVLAAQDFVITDEFSVNFHSIDYEYLE